MPSRDPVQVKCVVRARIPNKYGGIELYGYENNQDYKHHLAIVSSRNGKPIHSQSLDQIIPGETSQERYIRGATSLEQLEKEEKIQASSTSQDEDLLNIPVVRVHSQCFTGEVLGSERCDCGEQLQEAFRVITTSGNGIVVYMKQEGRGIGLFEKLRAYNLQDQGHDTVEANNMLGYADDLRTYDVAAAILKDLGCNKINLLSNNSDKVNQLTKSGIDVVERIPMIPQIWAHHEDLSFLPNHEHLHFAASPNSASTSQNSSTSSSRSLSSQDDSATGSRQFETSRNGSLSDKNSVPISSELERYLYTKAQKMGHNFRPDSQGSFVQYNASMQSKNM